MSDTLLSSSQSEMIQLAQAAEPIGHVENAEGTASLVRVDGSHVAAAVGTPVYEGDTAQTGTGGLIGIVFSDNSVFALGENGKMVVDDLVFDPSAHQGVSAFSIQQGVFSFISGQIAKASPEATVIHTPVATIGIRGTSLAGKAAPSGETNVITLVPDPDGHVGEATLSNNGGSQVLNTAFQTTQLSSAFLPPSIPIVLPKSVIDRVFSQVTRAVERMAPAPEQGGEEAGAPTGEGTQAPAEGGTEGAAVAGPEGAAARAEGEAPMTEGEQAVAQAFEQALAEGGSLESAFAAAVGEATKVAVLEGTAATVGPEGEVGFGGLAGVGGLISNLFSGGAEAFAGAAAGGDTGVFGPAPGPGNLLGGPESLLGGTNPFGLGDFLGAITASAENLEQQLVQHVDDQIQHLYTTTAPALYHYVADSSSVTLLSGYQDVVIGTTGNDTVTISGQAIAGEADSYTGQGGSDTVSLNYAGNNTFGFTNTAGTSSTLDLSNTGTGVQSIGYYGEGTLTFILPASGSQGYYQITGTTTDGSAANQNFIFNQVLANAAGSSSNKVNGSTGTDTVTLATGTNYLTVLGVEQVNHASTGTNATIFEFAMSSVSIAGGSGTDTVTLTDANIVSISGIETLTGGTGADAITLTAATTSATLDTGAGTDSVTLANGTNSLTISHAEAITGGTGADTVTLGAGMSSGTVDLAGGTDILTLAAGGNTLSISNVETITGGSGNDTVTFGGAITGAVFDGAAGTDILKLADGTNSVTVSNTETISGGTGADSVTFGTAASGTAALGGGSDSVTLGNFANSLTVTGVETVTGGTNNDVITVGDSTAVTFSGGAGADTITGGAGGDHLDGGIGSDVLYGQTGNDVFVYTTREVASIDTTDFSNSSQDDVFQFTSSVYGNTSSVTAVSLANGGAVGGDANNLLFLTNTVTDQNSSSTVDHADVLTIVNGLDFTAGAGGKNISRFVVFQDADDNGIYIGHLAASGAAATNYSDLDIVAKTAATSVTDLTAADFTFA